MQFERIKFKSFRIFKSFHNAIHTLTSPWMKSPDLGCRQANFMSAIQESFNCCHCLQMTKKKHRAKMWKSNVSSHRCLPHSHRLLLNCFHLVLSLSLKLEMDPEKTTQKHKTQQTITMQESQAGVQNCTVEKGKSFIVCFLLHPFEFT